MTQTCIHPNCKSQAIARDLCQTHYKRWQRHKSTEQTRPTDWGKREKHDLYAAYYTTRRYSKVLSPEWHENFWLFVSEVKPRPQKRWRLMPIDDSLPIGRDNHRWEAPKTKRTKESERRLASPEAFLDYGYKKKYGITFDEYEEMLLQQGGVCAICEKPETIYLREKLARMAVDHDHKTGAVRGLLCRQCNNGLGCFKDDTDIISKAIDYLATHASNSDKSASLCYKVSPDMTTHS